MPNKKDHLTPIELRTLLKSARMLHRQPEFDIRFRKRTTETSRLPGRLLVITPRKVGTAPKRNLLRRRLKALFYEERLFEYGVDIVVYCRKGSAEFSFQELKKLLLSLFQHGTRQATPSHE